MVIVQLLGGMGNQMFQYALGRTLSIRNKSKLKLDTTILLDHRPGVHAVNRNFDLDIFSGTTENARPADVWKYNWHGLGVAGKIAGRMHQMLLGNPLIRERTFAFDPKILTLSGDIYLAGLWQSYRYFIDEEKAIRADFQLRASPEDSALSMLSKIEGGRAVCLNVRRTDYVTHASTAQSLGFIGLDYYQDAVRLLHERYEDLDFYIFSDEIDWCRENFGFVGQKVTYVGHECAGPKYSWYLALMKACRYFIIPNSTFAWWAAWLSESSARVVIAPRNWFRHGKENADDLVPPEWIRI
jgi:hypothetical protein